MTDLPLHKISETASTITLGWTPPAAARGYIFYLDDKRVSGSLDGTKDRVRFSKPGPYKVEALGTLATGAFPAPVEPTDWWASVQTALPDLTNPTVVKVANETQLRWAVANLKASQYVTAITPFDVNGQLAVTAKLATPALIDLTSVTIRGGDTGGVWLNGSENVWLAGGNITATRKGIHIQDTIGCKWHGFTIHDCGDTGLFVTSINRDNVGLDLQGEISNCGTRCKSTNPIIDPHTEKCTGLHGAYVGARFTDVHWVTGSRIVLDVHDQHSGAACQVGGTIRDSFVAVRANRITFNAQTQVAGSGQQVWGEAQDLELQVEATDCAGRAVDTNGLYSGATGIRVTHGRATRCCTNPKLAGQSPFQPHAGVSFTDCVVVA